MYSYSTIAAPQKTAWDQEDFCKKKKYNNEIKDFENLICYGTWFYTLVVPDIGFLPLMPTHVWRKLFINLSIEGN
jgi:hypothetical protein